MDFEFDKEIDALLRRARSDEIAVSFDSHPDADVISAFAENALPEKTRQKYTAHLAECSRCRKILSNLIALNSEAETHAAFSTFPAGVAAAPAPWYRRLFAFPQLAYAMGALILLFSGFLAYIVLQNIGGTATNSTIAQKEETGEKPRGASGISSDGATTPTFSANTAANMTNSTVASNTAMANSNAIRSATNTTSNAANFAANANANAAAPVLQATPLPQATDLAKAETKEKLAENETKPNANQPLAAGAAQPKDDNKAQETDKERAERKRSLEDRDATDAQVSRSQPAPPAPKKAMRTEPGETQTIGGKTFRRVGGVWFDAAYGTQPQISIRRGSEDYKKLDSGLRSIAENLSGTIVVIWKDKAYRIQ